MPADADDGGMLRRLLGLPRAHRSVPLRSLRRYVSATASVPLRVAPVPTRRR